MASTALVWIRRDLRVHDHPALCAALEAHDQVVPVFVLDRRLVGGRFASGPRTWFLLACLAELGQALRERGGGLVVREGSPHQVLPALAEQTGAEAVYLARDVSPFATARDAATREALEAAGVSVLSGSGAFVADVDAPRKADGEPFSVFTPYWRRWEQLPRRSVLAAPDSLPALPGALDPGEPPELSELGLERELPDPIEPGERAAREAAERFLDGPVRRYHEDHDRLAGGTAVLSPYLHFGCLSARELEQRARELPGDGPAAFVRQLAWRDFYAHVLLNRPGNAREPHDPRWRKLEYDEDPELLEAWKQGRTGYPVVDAAMRQLTARGWMHNRARLIVGSFLTKDLHLDYRLGEAHFMRYLLCGDEAQNNGNWQWIASVGVDPAPYFRRMFNPTLQQQRFDPEGEYVRRWVPELRDVPKARMTEPWTMSEDEQHEAGCVIGRDYPAPVVEHKQERRRAMERYGAVPS